MLSDAGFGASWRRTAVRGAADTEDLPSSGTESPIATALFTRLRRVTPIISVCASRSECVFFILILRKCHVSGARVFVAGSLPWNQVANERFSAFDRP